MMGEREKTCPTAPTVRQAVENGSVCETAQPSTTNDTISAADSQIFRVADLLLTGEENALPMKHLRSVTGWKSREIRAMIQRERLEGVAICSNNATGYYIAATNEEREKFVRSMRRRAGEILKSAAAVEQGGDGA